VNNIDFRMQGATIKIVAESGYLFFIDVTSVLLRVKMFLKFLRSNKLEGSLTGIFLVFSSM
jgi:hypothetical protein